MIVYECKKVDDIKYGTYRYLIINGSYKWVLYSFQKFNIGDTIIITKNECFKPK